MNSRNAATVREFTRRFKNEHDVDAVDQLFARDFVHHFRMPVAPGLAGFKDVGRMMNAAFPDVRVTEEADVVVERSSAAATHLGTFLGIPPTGRQVRWFEIHIYRLLDAKIVEHWVELSSLELSEQLRAPAAAEKVEAR